jgi:hypothetical protein
VLKPKAHVSSFLSSIRSTPYMVLNWMDLLHCSMSIVDREACHLSMGHVLILHANQKEYLDRFKYLTKL